MKFEAVIWAVVINCKLTLPGLRCSTMCIAASWAAANGMARFSVNYRLLDGTFAA